MVAKINTGASLYGAISYNGEKVKEGTARVIGGNRMISSINGESQNNMQGVFLSFESYLAANRKTEKPVLHISLNPSPEDSLTDGQLAALAKDYMEKMNYGDQPYIIYMHEDIERRHVHIVSVSVDGNGRKISDSYAHRRSMNACRELEIKYGLKQVDGTRQAEETPYLKKADFEKGDVKRQIRGVLKSIGEYKFRTLGEYNALLSCYNIDVKSVRGEERSGKPFHGIVYSAMDGTGKVVSLPFKSSLFGRDFGYEGLCRRMKRNERDFRDGVYAPAARPLVSVAMRKARNREEFTRLLHDRGMDVVFRINDSKRIYGVTFIDHNRHEVYNGSALGKEFSANAFHSLFNGPSQGQDASGLTQEDNLWNGASGRETVIRQAFGMLDFEQHGRDYEEEALERLMRRRKKKKRRQGPSL